MIGQRVFDNTSLYRQYERVREMVDFVMTDDFIWLLVDNTDILYSSILYCCSVVLSYNDVILLMDMEIL